MPQDTIPDGLHGPIETPPFRSSSFGAPRAAPGGAARRTPPALEMPYVLDIRFTGSGSEYFRIWIVNLLLIVVTLGIYLPWAKVRRLKYFHGNTLVGDEPLGFHGNPRKMLRGYLLVGLMFVLYSVAGNFSPIAGLVALAIVMVVSPALLRASLQFRLANTSWRGLRFSFVGSLREVYELLWPALGVVVVSSLWAFLFDPKEPAGTSSVLFWLMFPMFLLFWASFLWVFWCLKKYQHDHYALASLQTEFTARFRQVAGIVMRMLGVFALLLLVGGVLTFGLFLMLDPGRTGASNGWRGGLAAMVPLALMLLVFVALKPYFTVRFQNLVWSHTGSDALQFRSVLRFIPMFWLTLKNWALIVLTLGLYWPFAAIAMARMRLQAVSVATRENPDALVSEMQLSAGEAAGDAAGDLFGLDIGL